MKDIKLNSKQLSVLNDIVNDNGTKRKRVLGHAGSGKSEVIIQCVKRIMREKTNVKILLTYYNISLREKYLKAIMEGESEEVVNTMSKNLHVRHYHGIFYNHIRNFYSNSGEEFKKFCKIEYNDLENEGYRFKEDFMNIAFNLPKGIYNYVFIDEMQDLRENVVPNLIDALKDGGKICLFADKAQKIYDNNQYDSEDSTMPNSNVPKIPSGTGFRGPWSRLDIVYRANSEIQEKAMEFAKIVLNDKYLIEDVVFYPPERQDSYIKYCYKFVDVPKDILYSPHTSILCTTLMDVDMYSRHLESNNIPYTSMYGRCLKSYENKKMKLEFDASVDKVKVSTIESFKGLESDNVVLMLKFSPDKEKDRELEKLYVGLSRAIKKLYIVNQNSSQRATEFLERIYGQYK